MKTATILAVEDSPTQAETLRVQLEQAGYRVVLASRGEEALRHLAHGEADLVLSDVVMPQMDGYELCRRIKESTPDLPVVLLTSLTDPLDVVHGLSAGADNFLRKPYDTEQLLSRLRSILYNREMRQSARTQMGLELFFLGRRFMITAERQQLLDLLVATFEDLVRINQVLREREAQLEDAHEAVAAQLRQTDVEHRRLSAVLAALPDAMAIADANGTVVEANEKLAELLDRPVHDIVGQDTCHTVTFVDHLGAPVDDATRPVRQALTAGSDVVRGHDFDLFLQRADGSHVPVIAKAAPIRRPDGRTAGAVGVIHPIGDLADYDPLTGLPTHRVLTDRLHQAVTDSATSNLSTGMLVIVVDGMQRIRDELPRASLDRTIVTLAHRLRDLVNGREVRAHTLAPSLTVLADGEFMLVLPALEDEVAAVQVAEHIRNHFHHLLPIDGVELPISVSIAVHVLDRTALDLAGTAAVAIKAARTLSREGGNQVNVVDTALHGRLAARLEQETRLRRAIGNGELVVYYQPTVELRTQRIVGTEALVRWNDPSRGLVPPGDFLPLAEETGLIVPLGWYVLERACRQTAAWRRELPGADRLAVSVNLAAEQLDAQDLADRVQTILRDSGLAPEALILEITETAAMRDAEQARTQLEALKQVGVRLAIDDFGTGYSSLLQLRRLPIDTLKVDRAFVGGMTDNSTDRAIVTATVNLAAALGLQVVAEGVETREQQQALAILGCHMGQGYLWSAAVPPQKLARQWAELGCSVRHPHVATPTAPEQRADRTPRGCPPPR